MTTAETDGPGGFLLGLYRLATTLATPALPGHLRRRVKQGKEDPARLEERWGYYDQPRPDGPLIWFHGASVGESLSILPLIENLRERHNDLGVLVTTGTVTSAQLMASRLPDPCQHAYVPLDLSQAVERFLDHWRPDLAVLVESELWPNLILRTKTRGRPLVLLNGRMSGKSHRTWSRLRPLAKRILDSFSLVLAQSEQDAVRFRDLGCKDCRHLGNLKFAAPALECDAEELQKIRQHLGHRPIWLAASTHPGEESIVAHTHQLLKKDFPDLLTLLVPRHPQRGPTLAEELGGLGLRVTRRATGEDMSQDGDIYLADSIGEMGLWYRLCDIVFVGGSLVPKGGQNFLEPAKLGAALLSGPHCQNFQVIAEGLIGAGALKQVRDAGELAEVVVTYLKDESSRTAAVNAAAEYAARETEVLERVLAALKPLLTDVAGRAREH